jgi:hypothetical protein
VKLPGLKEAAAAQAIEGFEHLPTLRPAHQQGEQLIEGHRLAHNRQPEEQRLLQGREPADLLLEQVDKVAKNQRARGEKGTDRAPEQIGDGLRHDLQGQRIARVPLNEACPLLVGPDHLMLGEQVLASGRIQPGQAHRPHQGPAALQPPQFGGFLPRGEQQTTLVLRLGDLPQ